MIISNRTTQLNCSVQFKEQLYCPSKKQPEPIERHLKILLETRQITEAVDFLETKGIRKSTAEPIFSPLSITSEFQEVAA